MEVFQRCRFEPSVIYCWPGDVTLVRLCAKIQATFEAKTIVHFMDNHIDKLLRTPLERTLNPIFINEINSLVKNSSSCMAISKSMAERYAEMFNTEFSVFNAPIDIKKFNLQAPKSKTSSFSLGYVGTLGGKQRSSFEAVTKAVSQIRSFWVSIYV